MECTTKDTATLYLVRGPIGVGKSTTVHALRERLQPASIVEPDVYKKQIDTTESSKWRREVAFKTALFLTKQLLQLHRTIIVELHSAHAEHYQQLASLASEYAYPLKSVLLWAPLQTCLDRAKERQVPGIQYEIDEAMVRTYWNSTFYIPAEPVLDTSTQTPAKVVDAILDIACT